ncbi:MAG: type II toxin-antitoxin system VapC family toxin [Burkholderiaceae bacterium]|nr:type II toxin-antitoxin system VapC family toxin [Burkholderiaceae bacterium]
MILLDTSVWIDHLRQGNAQGASVLETGLVLSHPFVIGELACGQLKARAEILGLLAALPQALVAQEQEVLFFIERHSLMGRGIGYIDAHLLTATALTEGARLWTRDKRLDALARELEIACVKPAH